jgi:hypothetical protein
LLFLFAGVGVSAQEDGNIDLPKAFQIGEHENGYGNLIKLYPESLLSVSKDSIELAYINWMYLLFDMEKHSKKINFDLNGLKIWLNVFWNKNGSIEYISYYPKPNSRNMEFNKLTAFFIDFVNNYKKRISGSDNFVHFGSARFPSFAEKYIPKENMN